jgi:hypothetical protein
MDAFRQAWTDSGPEAWIAALSAVLAVASFLLSRRTVRRQERLQLETLRTARDSDLIAWADAAIEGIAAAQGFCRDCKNGLLEDLERARRHSDLRTRLSALLDRGRLFFPNQADAAGENSPETEAAYAGDPHPAIDALYHVYRILTDAGRPDGLDPAAAVPEIVSHRRRFVSDVFRTIDPRRREAALRGLEP